MSSITLSPFHLAVPVHDLAMARQFYGSLLGLDEGRSSEHWIDYNFFGHQFVVHLDPDLQVHRKQTSNPVDGHQVPVPHFGVVLPWADWHTLAERLQEAQVTFAIAPHTRFQGQPGEQATMFFYDPSGNALEFKAFQDLSQLFAK